MGLSKLDQISVTTTGSAGSASGNATSSRMAMGEIVKIYVNFNASAPNTTDITIETATAPTETILVDANSCTDAWFYPARAHALNTDGSAINSWSRVWVEDYVKVSLAQCDALTAAVVVDIWYNYDGRE